MIIRDHRLEHGLKACTTVFQLLPLQNQHFLMTKPPTQKVLTIFLFLISKPHWWTRIKVTYMPHYLPIYSRGGGVKTVPTRGASDLKPLQSDSRLLTDEKFQKLKSKTANQSLFRAAKNSSNHNRLVRIVRRSLADQGMTHCNPDNEWPKANRIYISHWWIFSKSLRRQSKCNFKKFVV